MVERLGRLGEVWRDMRASKIEGMQLGAVGVPNFLWAIKPLQALRSPSSNVNGPTWMLLSVLVCPFTRTIHLWRDKLENNVFFNLVK